MKPSPFFISFLPAVAVLSPIEYIQKQVLGELPV